jgi:hypothetical protein
MTNATLAGHELLRHSLATLAYRTSKAVRDAPASFASFGSTNGSRTPLQILAHMGDLMDWGLSMARDKGVWNDATPLPWDQEVQRFFAAVTAWDAYLAEGRELNVSWESMLQGAIADALTHTGQLALLRRLSGSPIRGESYNKSPIRIGQTGFEQPAATPGTEFD